MLLSLPAVPSLIAAPPLLPATRPLRAGPLASSHTVDEEQQQRSELHALLKSLEPYAEQPLEDATTLPPAAYTSTALFEREVETIFRPGWLCVGHVCQVREKGDYLTLDLLGELLLLVNDGTRLRVLSRVCTHRWAPVVGEGRGTCKAFTCPFHFWSFRLDGSCIKAPLMDDSTAFDTIEHPLHEYRSEVVDGFVYVNLDGAAPPLSSQLAGMSQRLVSWRPDEMESYIELTYDCPFNWKIVVETFMECYHHLGAHEATFEPNFPARLSWTEDARQLWTVGHAKPRPGREVSAFEAGLPRFPHLETEAERQAFALYNVFPSQLLHAMPDRVLWFRLQPLSAERTVVTTFCLVPPGTMQMEDFEATRDEQRELMDKINREDIAVNEMQQVGARSGAVRPGKLNSKLEKALWQLNAFVARAVCAH